MNVQSSSFLPKEQSSNFWLFFLLVQYHIPRSHMWNKCCWNSTELSSCSMLDSHLPMAGHVVVSAVIWSKYGILKGLMMISGNSSSTSQMGKVLLAWDSATLILSYFLCSLRLVRHGVPKTWVNLKLKLKTFPQTDNLWLSQPSGRIPLVVSWIDFHDT